MKDKEEFIYWSNRNEKEAVLHRMFGKSPNVLVPEQIQGHSVTEIGVYAFSDKNAVPETVVGDRKPDIWLKELCGDYIEQITLPESVISIADLAFYNCRNLKEITVGAGIRSLGADAFMNCRKLHQIRIRARIEEVTGLRILLRQLNQNVRVVFESEGIMTAAFFFPEFMDGLDEIAPAHVFRRKIIGEGFRARQSFTDERIVPEAYDAVFAQALVEESEENLLMMAVDRFIYPLYLRNVYKKKYEEYMRSHDKVLMELLLHDQRIEAIPPLLLADIFSESALDHGIRLAQKWNMTRVLADLMLIISENRRKPGRSRYSMDDI
ncbi:MAG: leucine-rich repeat domain-containing protein [Lachnospiraceae bacterium]